MKDKKKKFGIKFFAEASSIKGYIFELVPYTGKTFEYDKKRGLGTSVLLGFAKKHINENIHITFDNFYSSMEVIKYCHENNIKFTCTWNQKRKCFPNLLRSVVIHQKNQFESYRIEKNTDTIPHL